MADFSIISDVSNQILKFLRESICPELIQSPEALILTSPTDKKSDYQMGIYLYDIQELREYQSREMINVRSGSAQYPPKPLTLFYAAYINSKAQMMSSSDNEQRILGRTIQALMDKGTLEDVTGENGEPASITLLQMSFEEKSKIWSTLNEPYQLAIYFSVSPALLSSRRVRTFQRVVSADFNVQTKQ